MSPTRPAPALRWRCLPFGALLPHTLYGVLRLRAEVFVVEQACAFQDLDDADPHCLHLLGEAVALEPPRPSSSTAVPTPLAYARLVPAGLKYQEASIGRVVTAPAQRGSGLGHALMAEAVRQLQQLWGAQAIRIGAQAHLQGFYAEHGFITDSPVYDEDGIDHVEMIRRKPT